jgi:hypothetical protein
MIRSKQKKKGLSIIFRQASLAIMKMNLKPDSHGNIYFNEVLFGFFENLYTNKNEFIKGLNKEAI